MPTITFLNSRIGVVGTLSVAPSRVGWCTHPTHQSLLRRVPVRGDDLLRGPARHLGHAVELPGKAAGPGGGRAQLYDQFADLGFRHHGANAVPARPALAGVEAENLAAPSGQDRIDLRGGVGGTDDLDYM